MPPPSEEFYDLNFCFPVPPILESSRVRLVPFIPATHLHSFHDLCISHPSVFTWLPFGPVSSVAETAEWVENFIRKDSGRILFAIYDLADSGSHQPETGRNGSQPVPAFAGVLAYINSSPLNLCTEIGAVIIFPPWQRTHVAKNAVGLLLKYALDLPLTAPEGVASEVYSGGGIGLRRVVWQANARNTPSIKLAQRMGFQLEGVLRWDRALPPGKDDASNQLGGLLGKEGTSSPIPLRKGDPKPGWVGRDTAMLGLCWDDWEMGAKDMVQSIIEG